MSIEPTAVGFSRWVFCVGVLTVELRATVIISIYHPGRSPAAIEPRKLATATVRRQSRARVKISFLVSHSSIHQTQISTLITLTRVKLSDREGSQKISVDFDTPLFASTKRETAEFHILLPDLS